MCWYRSQRRGPREVSLLYRDRHRSLQGYSPKVIRATEGAYGVRTAVMADLHTSCSRDDSEQRLLTLRHEGLGRYVFNDEALIVWYLKCSIFSAKVGGR